jgi:3-oxoacyl-[acyl-carrier-protein] synthase-3
LISNKSVFADVQLYRSVHDNMVARYPFSTSEITKVFANNLFLPVLRVKETSIGLSTRQLYLDNVVRHGHCFSADPLINMHDYCANNSVKGGEKFLLTSNASGLRATLLVEYFQGD